MILSPSARFVFIHVQKTGGSSLKAVIRRSVPDCQRLLGTHDPARAGLKEYGAAWNDYFRFAFVRNPWDRLVSWYTMISRRDSNKPQVNRNNEFWTYVRREARSFEDFLVRCTDVIDDFDGKKCIAFDQLDYLTGESGRLIVDFVGRFERLAEDGAQVFSRIGIRATPLPHRLKLPRQHYSHYYTPALRDLVGERHRRDIDFFGYKFKDEVSSVSPRSGGSPTVALD